LNSAVLNEPTKTPLYQLQIHNKIGVTLETQVILLSLLTSKTYSLVRQVSVFKLVPT